MWKYCLNASAVLLTVCITHIQSWITISRLLTPQIRVALFLNRIYSYFSRCFFNMMQTWKDFVGGVDGMFLTFFSPHQSWTQLTPHFCPFTNTSTKRSIQGTQHNVNRNRYGREITLVLFLRLFLTKSRKKALVLIYRCLQRLFLTAYISRLTTHLRRQDICNCANSPQTNLLYAMAKKTKQKKREMKWNSLDCTISTSAELTTFPIENSAVYPLFLFRVQSSLVLHDISTFFSTPFDT